MCLLHGRHLFISLGLLKRLPTKHLRLSNPTSPDPACSVSVTGNAPVRWSPSLWPGCPAARSSRSPSRSAPSPPDAWPSPAPQRRRTRSHSSESHWTDCCGHSGAQLSLWGSLPLLHLPPLCSPPPLPHLPRSTPSAVSSPGRVEVFCGGESCRRCRPPGGRAPWAGRSRRPSWSRGRSSLGWLQAEEKSKVHLRYDEFSAKPFRISECTHPCCL